MILSSQPDPSNCSSPATPGVSVQLPCTAGTGDGGGLPRKYGVPACAASPRLQAGLIAYHKMLQPITRQADDAFGHPAARRVRRLDHHRGPARQGGERGLTRFAEVVLPIQ